MTLGVERAIGHSFSDSALLEEALTHSSFATENDGARHNERLEFLGDAVLELCVSEALFKWRPDWDEGRMTDERSRIVRETSLAVWARELGIDRALRVGRSIVGQSTGKSRSIMADAMEAVIGAVYLDAGIEAARALIMRMMPKSDEMPKDLTREEKDPKSMFQELLQARGEPLPTYVLVSRLGPDHAAVFDVELRLADGTVAARGRGSSKKSAEFAAARSALESIAR